MRRRHDQHFHSVRQGVIRIGAGGEQGLHRFRIVLYRGEDQSREAALRRCVDVGAVLDQRFDDARMPFGRRPHQSSLAFARFHGVYVRARGDQLLDGFDAARAGGDHQRGFAVPSRSLGVRSSLQQLLHQAGVAVGAG